MSESEKYKGYGWIKVKREDPTIVGDKKYVSEEHHIAEADFLIKKVRELAEQLDAARALSHNLMQQMDQKQQYESRRTRYDADYLPWQEDERD